MSSLLFGKRKRETKVATLLLCMNDVFSFLLHHRAQRAFSQKSDEEEETTTRLFFFEAKRFLLRGTTTTSTRGTLRFFCPRRPRNEWISKSTSLRRRSDRRRKRREREHVRSRTQTGVRGNGASSFGLESLSPSLSLSVFMRFVRIESWRTRQRGRRRRLLGAGKRNVDD